MAYNFSGVKNTTELNDVVKFIHYYAKVKEANPSMVDEKLIAQKVENDHGVLHSEDQLKFAKEINNGVMPKREDIQRIISEFQAYIKQKMQDEEDEFNKADAEFKTAEAIQQEGENAADQLDEMHRQRRNTRIKQGVLGAVLGFGACALLGPVVAPLLGLASLGTGATLLISAGASGYFAKFRADRSIKEAGLDDRTLIKELQKKVKEAASQYNNYKSKEQVKNFAESNRNTTQREFQNYEQIGSNYEVLQENERNDAHTRLLQLQNDINSVKNTTMEGMLASGGMGVADYVDDKTKATTASSEITAIIQQLQNLPLDSNFQKEMAKLVAEAEKKKAEIDAIDIPNKKYGDEVKSAIQALYNEYESITGLVSGLSDGLRNNADITAQLNACENIYNPITSSLDGEKVGAIESKLNAFKTEGAKLKGIVRTAWITEQNPENLPEDTPEARAYKTAVENANTWNDRAKNAPADQKANAEAMAELTFMKARLSNLEQQRAATGKEELWYNDSGRNVVINVKRKIESAINRVDAELSAVNSRAKTPVNALAEATNNVNINNISGNVRLLAGKGPTQAQRDTTDRELGELISKLMAELSQCKTNIQSALPNKYINGLVQPLDREVDDLKKKIEDENSPTGYKYKVKQAKSQADLDRIKKDAEVERDEIKKRLDEAEENAKDFAKKIKEIEEAYDKFRKTYIENLNYADENNIIDKDRFLELKKDVSGVYISLSSRKDNKLIDIKQAEADLQTLTTKISENEAEIDKLKQPQSVIDRKNALKQSLKQNKNDINDRIAKIIKYKEVEQYLQNATNELDKLDAIKDADIDNASEDKLEQIEKNVNTVNMTAKGFLDQAESKNDEIVKVCDKMSAIKNSHNSREVALEVQNRLRKNGDNSLKEYNDLIGKIDEYLGNSSQVELQQLNEYHTQLISKERNYRDAVNKAQQELEKEKELHNENADDEADKLHPNPEEQDVADDNYKKDALRELADIEKSNNNRFNEYAKNLSREKEQLGKNALDKFFCDVRDAINSATTKNKIQTLLDGSKDVVNKVKEGIQSIKDEEHSTLINSEEAGQQGLPEAEELKGLPDGRKQQILDKIGSELFGKNGSTSQVERVSQEALNLENYKQTNLQELEEIRTQYMAELDNANGLSGGDKVESRAVSVDHFNGIKAGIEKAETQTAVDKCMEVAKESLNGLKELIQQNSTESEGEKDGTGKTEHRRTLMDADRERLIETKGDVTLPKKEEHDGEKGMPETSSEGIKVDFVLVENIKAICSKVKGGFSNFRNQKVIGEDKCLVDEGEVRDLCNTYINKSGISEEKRKKLGLDNESIKNMPLEQLVSRCNGLNAEAENDGDEPQM